MPTNKNTPPPTPSKAPPPLGNWLSRWRLEYTSPSSTLYPNTRQQVEVTMTLEAKLGQVIPDEALASVRLLSRLGDGRYAEVPMHDDGSSLWFASDKPNEYQYYPVSAAIPPDEGESPGEVLTKTFYLHSRAPAGTREEFWGRITRTLENEETYDYVSDGSHTGFEASVVLSTTAIPAYNVPADYTFERALISGEGNSDLFVWEYDIVAAHTPFGRLPFLSAEAIPAGMIQWSVRAPDESRAGHVGFAAPGESGIRYNDRIAFGDSFVPQAHVSRVRDDTVVIVLQGGNNIPYDSESAQHHNGPIVVHAIDKFGNTHQLRVSFESPYPAGRGNLVLS